MKHQELTQKLYDNHKVFIDYLNSLSDEEFSLSTNGKWTPGQQLEHLYLCIQPMTMVLGNKPIIEPKFGKVDRPTWSYDDIVKNYKIVLEKGGKAPEKYLPPAVELSRKNKIIEDLLNNLQTLSQNIQNYSEQEIDTLLLPHPLLGKLTIREMMHLMTHHVLHHLEQTKQNLKVVVNG